MEILVIFTGGTIGSIAKDGWISPDGQTKRELISHYEQAFGTSVNFTTLSPYSILSEQLCASKLNDLIGCVKDNLNRDYDGIIVTHGTDTIQFSASALAYAIGCSSIPVVMVSSNYPLGDERANGHDNFSAAVEFIKQKAGCGVFVSYRNGNAPTTFHCAQTLLSHREADDYLYSLNDNAYATLDGEKVVILGKNNCKCCKIGEFTLCDKPNILVVNACPGASYEHNLDNASAVILRPYHSGTLNTDSEDFIDFCNKAKGLNKPVFVVNINEGDAYASSKTFTNLGIIPVYSSTFTSVYMRIWIAVSRGEDLLAIF